MSGIAAAMWDSEEKKEEKEEGKEEEEKEEEERSKVEQITLHGVHKFLMSIFPEREVISRARARNDGRANVHISKK